MARWEKRKGREDNTVYIESAIDWQNFSRFSFGLQLRACRRLQLLKGLTLSCRNPGVPGAFGRRAVLDVKVLVVPMKIASRLPERTLMSTDTTY